MTTYRCQCGKLLDSSSPCAWSGPLSEMVVVEWMPQHFRASHEAAGNRGIYPHNGAERSVLERSCAELLAADDEWIEILAGEDPANYVADEEESLAPRPDAAVEAILAEIWHAPDEHWDDEAGEYRLSIATEYDEDGELVEDVVDRLNDELPRGWIAEWVGDGNGDEEDLTVRPVD